MHFNLNYKTDYPLFDCISAREGWAIICHVRESQLIASASSSDQITYTLTAKGWELLGAVPLRRYSRPMLYRDGIRSRARFRVLRRDQACGSGVRLRTGSPQGNRDER
jgi:hypothetical protein